MDFQRCVFTSEQRRTRPKGFERGVPHVWKCLNRCTGVTLWGLTCQLFSSPVFFCIGPSESHSNPFHMPLNPTGTHGNQGLRSCGKCSLGVHFVETCVVFLWPVFPPSDDSTGSCCVWLLIKGPCVTQLGPSGSWSRLEAEIWLEFNSRGTPLYWHFLKSLCWYQLWKMKKGHLGFPGAVGVPKPRRKGWISHPSRCL